MKYPIYEEVESARQEFPGVARRRMTKVTGSLCVEVIRKYLAESGIPVSSRDAFIAGVPIENDLIIPRLSSQPEYGVIYKPEDVAAVLEIKYSGAYSRDVAPDLHKQFGRIVSTCPNARCAYVTVCENERFKWKVTTEKLGFKAFTLYWVNREGRVEKLGDSWESLVQFLREALTQVQV